MCCRPKKTAVKKNSDVFQSLKWNQIPMNLWWERCLPLYLLLLLQHSGTGMLEVIWIGAGAVVMWVTVRENYKPDDICVLLFFLKEENMGKAHLRETKLQGSCDLLQMLTLLPLECLLERGGEHLGWITTKPIITINNTHVLQTVCGRKEGRWSSRNESMETWGQTGSDARGDGCDTCCITLLLKMYKTQCAHLLSQVFLRLRTQCFD